MRSHLVILPLLTIALTTASAQADTAIECAAEDTSLSVRVPERSGTYYVDATVNGVLLSSKMKVYVSITPPGPEVYRDKTAVTYEGYYKSKTLNLAFLINQGVDSDGNVAAEPRNTFAINAKVFGDCIVTRE